MEDFIPRLKKFIGEQDPAIREYLCILTLEDQVEVKGAILKECTDFTAVASVLGPTVGSLPHVSAISILGRTVNFITTGRRRLDDFSFIVPLTAFQKF